MHRGGEEVELAQRLEALLAGAEERIETRIAELAATLGRILARFRAAASAQARSPTPPILVRRPDGLLARALSAQRERTA